MAVRKAVRLDRSPVHLLHRARQAVEICFEAQAGMDGLTARQLAVLTAVAGHAGANQTQLVEATGIDRSTLADIVKRLAKKGFLKRSRTPADARAYAVKLTDDGEKVLWEAEPVARGVDGEVAKALGERLEPFLESLQVLVARMEKRGK